MPTEVVEKAARFEGAKTEAMDDWEAKPRIFVLCHFLLPQSYYAHIAQDNF